MTSLLSIILSLILALSGAGELPAVPTTATEITISDICLELQGQEYSLSPELVMTYGLGSEQVAGTLQVRMEDEVLFPMAATLDADSLRFTLGENVYVVDSDTLAALLGCDPAQLATIVEAISPAIAEAMTPADAEAGLTAEDVDGLFEVIVSALEPNGNTGETTIAGEDCETRFYTGELSLSCLAGLMDSLASSSVARYAEAATGALELLNTSCGTDCASFAELADTLSEGTADAALDGELSCEYGSTDNGVCFNLFLNLENGVYVGETYLRENDCCSFAASVSVSEEDVTESLSLLLTLSDVGTDHPAMSYSFDISRDEAYEIWEYEEDAEDAYIYNSDLTVSVNCNAAVTDGLKYGNMNLCATSTTGTEAGDGSDSETYTDFDYSLFMEYDEEASETGGINAELDLDLDLGEFSCGLSCDIGREEVSIDTSSLFEGKEEVVLTDDYSADCYTELSSDMLFLTGDLATLCGDEGIAGLTEGLFQGGFTSGSYDDEYYMDDDMFEFYDGDWDEDWDEDWDYDSYEEVTYEYVTAEEGMERFAGTHFTFTPPEGYEQDASYTQISSDNTQLFISYNNTAEDCYDCITLSIYDYGYTYGDQFILESDGSLSALNGPLVNLTGYDDDEDLYYCASFMIGSTDVTITFDDRILEEVQELLAGLQL